VSWTDGSFEALANLVAARTGLTFAPERQSGAELAIRRVMARACMVDPARFRERVARDASLLDDLIGELTIGETYFFREPGQYQFIREVILPEIARSSGSAHTIRVWSAGCASGEEAYSLAMLCDEEGLSNRVHLLATDIARGALEKARQATYSVWSLRGEGAAAARPYLSHDGDRYVIKGSIRKQVAFEYLNLALDLYPSFASGTWGMDLILCRNVLIYFDRGTVQNVAARLHASLAEGGWLITASSDPPLADWADFETVVAEQGVFYRKRSRPVVFSPTLEALAPEPRTDDRQDRSIPAPAPGRAMSTEEILFLAREDLSRGDYDRAAERTRDLIDDAGARALHVRALANLDAALAERACAEAAARHPTSTELHYLRALLLLGLGREAESAREARRVIYLDRSLAVAHLLLGSILQRHGDRKGAWRCYRNAHDLCAARPDDEIVPLSDNEPAGRLAEAARVQRERLAPFAEPRR
jgi:chemotaxis protein methyltransferase CheR